MIRLDVVQGSDEWRQARVGLPTASGFDSLLTAKTLKPSTSAHGYLCKLMAEHYLGRPLEDAETGFIGRGRAMEEEGLSWYEMARDVAVERVGLCLSDDRRYGCSPDGLVGDDGGLEVKVPAAHVQIKYLLDPSALVSDYRGQVQGNLLVTHRKWWDLVSYNPEIPPVVMRVKRDDEYLSLLVPILADFLGRLDVAKATAVGWSHVLRIDEVA
jgi:hypothetical protein